MKLGLLIVTIICFCTITVAIGFENSVFKIGIFPYKMPRTMLSTFTPIKKKIEAVVGVPVKIVTTSTAAIFKSRLKSGEYDLAWACVDCYFSLGHDSSYRVIAGGFPEFNGGVIVKKNSKIYKLDDLHGKDIAAIGEHSYAGYRYFKNLLEKKEYSRQEISTFISWKN
jgi:ABC-type phosphate/phosphonate transport system substrate-binding protein